MASHPAYPDVLLLIDGAWCKAASGKTLPVVNPATGDPIGTVAHAERADLDRAARDAQQVPGDPTQVSVEVGERAPPQASADQHQGSTFGLCGEYVGRGAAHDLHLDRDVGEPRTHRRDRLLDRRRARAGARLDRRHEGSRAAPRSDRVVPGLGKRAAGGACRGRPRMAVLHERHDRAAEGSHAHAPQPADDDAQLLRRHRPGDASGQHPPRGADLARIRAVRAAARGAGRDQRRAVLRRRGR